MCRFSLYMGPPITLGSLVTEPAHSLIRQSVHSDETEEPLNGDGFGVAWYAPRMGGGPAVFRSITPAWSNQNLLSLSRVVESPCILAHVRAATSGQPVSESNCHPFDHGRYAFMHNGDLGAFAAVRRKFLSRLSDEAFDLIAGTTDSEHLFAMFCDEARAAGDGPDLLAAALCSTIRKAVALVTESGHDAHSYLNIAVTDGRSAAVSRFSTDPDPANMQSLYLARGLRYLCDGGVCRMLRSDSAHGAVLISSERLSDDTCWEPVRPNHIVHIKEDGAVELMDCDRSS